MRNLSKILSAGGEDFDRYTVSLVAIELPRDRRRDGECIKWDTEIRALVGYSPTFGTVKTFGTYDEAKRAAVNALNGAIFKLTSAGYRLLCSPKEIDTDNHDWRCISRIRTPQGKRVALIAYLAGVVASFDPWMY